MTNKFRKDITLRNKQGKSFPVEVSLHQIRLTEVVKDIAKRDYVFNQENKK